MQQLQDDQIVINKLQTTQANQVLGQQPWLLQDAIEQSLGDVLQSKRILIIDKVQVLAKLHSTAPLPSSMNLADNQHSTLIHQLSAPSTGLGGSADDQVRHQIARQIQAQVDQAVHAQSHSASTATAVYFNDHIEWVVAFIIDKHQDRKAWYWQGIAAAKMAKRKGICRVLCDNCDNLNSILGKLHQHALAVGVLSELSDSDIAQIVMHMRTRNQFNFDASALLLVHEKNITNNNLNSSLNYFSHIDSALVKDLKCTRALFNRTLKSRSLSENCAVSQHLLQMFAISLAWDYSPSQLQSEAAAQDWLQHIAIYHCASLKALAATQPQSLNKGSGELLQAQQAVKSFFRAREKRHDIAGVSSELALADDYLTATKCARLSVLGQNRGRSQLAHFPSKVLSRAIRQRIDECGQQNASTRVSSQHLNTLKNQALSSKIYDKQDRHSNHISLHSYGSNNEVLASHGVSWQARKRNAIDSIRHHTSNQSLESLENGNSNDLTQGVVQGTETPLNSALLSEFPQSIFNDQGKIEFYTRQGAIFYLLHFLTIDQCQRLITHDQISPWLILYFLADRFGALDHTLKQFFVYQLNLTDVQTLNPLTAFATLSIKTQYQLPLWFAEHFAMTQQGLRQSLKKVAEKTVSKVLLANNHLDIYFHQSAIDIDIRIAGLDINPGWQPLIATVVNYHYLDDPQLLVLANKASGNGHG